MGGGRGETLRMFRCPCGLRARNARRSNKTKGAHKRGPNRKGPRAINTRITISATNVPLGTLSSSSSPAPFSYPCGHDAHVHILSPPFPFPFLSVHITRHASLFLSPFILRPMPLYFASSSSLFLFSVPASVLSFSHAPSSPFLFSPPRNSSRYIFFSGEVCGNTPRPAGELVLIFD